MLGLDLLRVKQGVGSRHVEVGRTLDPMLVAEQWQSD